MDLCTTSDMKTLGLYGVITFCCAMIELWLGRTEKVKASSILELIFMSILTVAFWVTVKLKGNKNGNSKNGSEGN